jgi:hypothetical protein
MQHDAWFFVGIFAFIFLLWAATGGPSHPISFAGPYLSAPSPIGTGTYIGLPTAPFGIGGSNVTLPNPDTGSSYNPDTGSSYTGGSGSITGGGSLDNVDFGPPSSYRGLVTMSHYVSGAGSSNPDNEYVTISLSSSAKAPVTLSGWSLESGATGNAAIIPAGTEVPTSGSVEALQAIVLNPGDTAIVASGASPIGASFRENECIGYFAEYQQFSPALSSSCPSPTAEMLKNYPDYIRDAACINYIKTLPACTLEITPPTNVSYACAQVLENYLSYNGCVTEHQNDTNFKGKTWRVYLGRTSAMWRTQYEVVKLVDSSGNTVDAFSY